MTTSLSPQDGNRSSLSSASGMTQPIPKKSLQIRTDKPRPHLCAICTRGFARLEHLKRHERAHTNEKPYQCAACGRCFARRDLVLRHQQKVHSNIFSLVRRGSLPVTLNHGNDLDPRNTPPVTGLGASNETVIILHNNTNAKAPLPNSSYKLTNSAHGVPVSDSGEDSPRNTSLPSSHQSNNDTIFTNNEPLAKTSGIIPSPNTNSYNNTPAASAGNHGTSSSFSDLDMLQNHSASVADYTQQPSPLTGDSPDMKEKQKGFKDKARQDFLTEQLEFKSSLDLKNFSSYKGSGSNPRHASFSAVSGLSYTNLQDALAIRNNQISQGPPQVGFATPQLNPTELAYPGLSNSDLNDACSDWYDLKFTALSTDPSRISQSDGLSTGDSLLGKSKNESLFKMSLDTIPSESNLPSALLRQNPPNNIISGHQFQNPNHPHHIPGTTPMTFDFPSMDQGEPNDMANMGYGAGVSPFNPDIMFLQGQADPKELPSRGTVSVSPRASGVDEKHQTEDSKRRKIGFSNDINDLDWLEQIKGVPLTNEVPLASTSTGFLGMPFMKDEFQSDEVFSLFQLKQDDLVRQKSLLDLTATRRSPKDDSRSSSSASRRASRAQFTIGEPNEFITEELRAKIVEASNVSDDHFPPKEDLNAYMKLYGEEFNTFFSFIHLPTLKNPMIDNFENIPMILAMCSIGALYSYHDSNTLLLFNLSKYHIHKFFENEVTPNKLQSKKVPIMAHQCLVLHIFISMFLNEPNMVEITMRQMESMVGLIRSTNFHRPLEQFLAPPPPISNPNDQTNLQNNFGYFIMAQTRIRTALTFYQLEVIRSILLGCPIPMTGSEIRSGIHCSDENLWRAGNATEWHSHFMKCKDQNIVEVSNNQTLEELLAQLVGSQFTDHKSNFEKSLGLLMYVHEQISTSYCNNSGEFDPLTWRVECRPRLEYLINSWEEYFVKNGGSTLINNQNETLLNRNAGLKLILPLVLLAKIRLSVNFSPITSAVLHRDWSGMNNLLSGLDKDLDGLKEACKYALDVLVLWTHNISVVNDAKQTSVRTPVYFLTAVFIAVIILGKTLDSIENGKTLSVAESAFWLSCENVLRSIDTALSSQEQSSYSEFLNRQSGGIFDFARSKAFHKNIEAVRSNDKTMKVKSVKKCKLSTHVLGLGVRILADAPLWPLAMRFAEALKHMALDISGRM
ncbi:hypothetical protein JCM33374_g4935 [Metschnikowia sp. JCM 33374]|nr:hypothetical protein JCM33374_g4935 [Metschnikowia sp. JCM 33374]